MARAPWGIIEQVRILAVVQRRHIFKWTEKLDWSQANATILTTHCSLHCCLPDTFGTGKIKENELHTLLTKEGDQHDWDVIF